MVGSAAGGDDGVRGVKRDRSGGPGGAEGAFESQKKGDGSGKPEKGPKRTFLLLGKIHPRNFPEIWHLARWPFEMQFHTFLVVCAQALSSGGYNVHGVYASKMWGNS